MKIIYTKHANAMESVSYNSVKSAFNIYSSHCHWVFNVVCIYPVNHQVKKQININLFEYM